MNHKAIDFRLRQSVSIVCEQTDYFLCCNDKREKIKSHYAAVAKLLKSRSRMAVDDAKAALVGSGMDEIAADFTLGQFLVDYAAYIE